MSGRSNWSLKRSEAVAPTYYHATANPAPVLPALGEALTADVCVVGGGLTGVSTALHLAERGYSVVLLEAERIGWGASGRNGGQIVSGYSCSMAKVVSLVGQAAARRFWDLAAESIEDVGQRVRRHDIACDLRWGYLFAALNRRQFDDLAEEQRELADLFGYEDTRLVDHELIQTLVGTDVYVGGLLDQGGGQLHPLNYLLGLADAARQAGAVMFEQSRVTGIEYGPRPVVHTDAGQVRAHYIALAGNAYLGGLVPPMARRLAPVVTYIGVTEPLSPEQALAAMPQDLAVSDCNVALNYYRMTADDRLIFGGGASYTGREPRALDHHVRRRIASVFPDLADVGIAQAWSGKVGITLSRFPDFGRVTKNVYYAQGFSGHGVTLTGLAGKLIAEAIAGQAERFDAFAGVPHRPFPGGILRTPALALGMAWFKLKDRLG